MSTIFSSYADTKQAILQILENYGGIIMRKLYAYAPDSRCPVQEFLQGMNEKIQDKLRFQLAYILDENSSFVEPYVKHFSLAKYRPFYEIRVIAAKTMVRVIFHEKNGEIILLYAFHKRDRKDTERALEAARRIYDEITDRGGGICREYLREVKPW